MILILFPVIWGDLGSGLRLPDTVRGFRMFVGNPLGNGS